MEKSRFAPILLLLLAVAINSQEQHTLESLGARIKQLEQQLNQTQVGTPTQTDINHLHQRYLSTQHQILQLKHTLLNNQLSGLQSSQSNSDPVLLLQKSLQQLETNTRGDIRLLLGQVTSIQSEMQSLANNHSQEIQIEKASLEALSSEVKSSVNLYEKCIQDTQRCMLSPANSNNVWHRCNTNTLPLNTTGYYTLDRRCEYESNYSYMVSTVLRKSGSNVYCYCHVIYPYSTSLNTVSTGLRGDCTLVVTRCPMSQTVYN